MTSLSGNFLVASPHLKDPNFVRTVVLMIQHGEQGALGVVLTRPGDKSVRQVWEMIEFPPVECDDQIFVGGPVSGPLIAVHTCPEGSDYEILPGLFVSTHNESVDSLVRNDEAAFRLFSGHAGWGGGQLEGELEVGGWLRTTATVDDVFSDYETLWQRVARRIGLEIIAPGVEAQHIPDDPSVN